MSESNGHVSREVFLARRPRKTKDVQVPGRGTLRLQELSELDVQEIERPDYKPGKGGGFTISLAKFADRPLRYIVKAVIDPATGQQLLSNADIEDLRQMDKATIDFLYGEIESLCSLDVEKKEAPTGNSQ